MAETRTASRRPHDVNCAGPMMTSNREDLTGSYTHLNAGSRLSLATSAKWEPANTMNVNPDWMIQSDWTT